MTISTAISEPLSFALPDTACRLGRVIVIECCPMLRAGIRRLLAQPCFQVDHYLEISTIVDVPRILMQHRADLVMLDLAGQGILTLEGVRAIRQILGATRRTPLLVCTSLADPRWFRQLFLLGVQGIYHKQDPLEALIHCVLQVMDRQVGFSPLAAELLLARVRTPLLSNCEIDVLEALCHGKSVTVIAHIWCRDIRTISAHKRNAMNKLGFRNNNELYSWLACYGAPT